jgi:hypothetical protein
LAKRIRVLSEISPHRWEAALNLLQVFYFLRAAWKLHSVPQRRKIIGILHL